MNIRFGHPEFFIALLAVPLMVLLFRQVTLWKRSATRRIGDPLLVRELTKNYSPGAYLLKFIVLVLVFVAIVGAAVHPLRPGAMENVERRGVDIMIALDVSNSMLAQDIKPNRLEWARQLAANLIHELENDRVGLVLFAGRAYMQMPLTTDHAAAGMYIQNASPAVVPTQGTMISDALKLCATAFNSMERKYKSIVLITDGEDHDPASMEVARELAENGVMVNAVGIGSAVGTPIPDILTGQYKKDVDGNTVLSKLNEQQLRDIATATRGVYVNAENPDAALEAVLGKLATIEKTGIEDMAFKDYIHYFQWFIAVALILLIVEFLLPEKKMSQA